MNESGKHCASGHCLLVVLGLKTEMKVTNLIQLSLFLKSIFFNLPQG
jgi:hypothetical protein